MVAKNQMFEVQTQAEKPSLENPGARSDKTDNLRSVQRLHHDDIHKRSDLPVAPYLSNFLRHVVPHVLHRVGTVPAAAAAAALDDTALCVSRSDDFFCVTSWATFA
jgi:hypothetical protein